MQWIEEALVEHAENADQISTVASSGASSLHLPTLAISSSQAASQFQPAAKRIQWTSNPSQEPWRGAEQSQGDAVAQLTATPVIGQRDVTP